MKFHAVVSDNASAKFIIELNKLRPVIERKIVEECFKVPFKTFGPAELCVQVTDLSISEKSFVLYEISGVTYKPERDFKKALLNMQNILARMVEDCWQGEMPVQIMVVIHTANPNEQNHPFESDPVYCDPENGELSFKT